jgi:hypothetical protein
MTSAVSIWLVAIIGVSAGMKAWRPRRAAMALATYGIADPRAQRAGVGALVAIELGLVCALIAGVPWAPAAIAGMFLIFAVVTLAALLAGRAGQPCACFGSDSRLGWSSPARAVALSLAAGVMALGWLPVAPSAYDRWLTVGLSIAVMALAALALATLALAREVGVLRLAAGGAGALEIPEEGPEIGSPQAWAASIDSGPRALLRLAVFTSEGCPLCRQVEPAVAHVARDPLLSVQIFDEVADTVTWGQAGVPGSPYAVVLSLEGVALAKGTFNGLGQLESVLATGRFRERGLPLAA